MKIIKIAVLTILTTTLTPATAFAGGTITPNSKTVSQQNSISDGGGVGGMFEEGLSYCCEFFSGEPLATFNVETSISDFELNPALTGVDRTRVTPVMGVAAFDEIGFVSLGNRMCFTPTVTGGLNFSFTDVLPDPHDIDYKCVETTLYGGYNTNANPLNFLEIINISNATITGSITAQNFDGSLVINGTSFSVDAGQRIDIDLHSPAGQNVFGALRINHDGPLGSLQANTSFYQADLTLRGTVPAKTRERE